MNMHAPFSVGIVTGDVVVDGCGGGLGRLLEGDGTRDLGVPTQDGDCALHPISEEPREMNALLERR